VGNRLTVSSGTGKFADVTGGELLSGLIPPLTGPCVPGTTSAPFSASYTGTLTYS
jgi:hypothetical protein